MTIKEFINSNITTAQLMSKIKENYKKYEYLNAFINTNFDEYSTKTIPLAIKDLFCIKDTKTTAGSKMLQNYVSPITSTVVQRLLNNQCFCVGKTNLDEFAMGSTGVYSFFGKTINPWKNNNNEDMSPGGSSSGSVAAVAAGLCLAALGTETGGSCRQPSAWCGTVGYKPTYGAFSRYGVIDFGSNLDCPGLITNTVEDCIWLASYIFGKDENDYTTVDVTKFKDDKKKRFGVFNNIKSEDIEESSKFFEQQGYECIHINFDYFDLVLPIYYILSSVQVASNLSRYSGVLYHQNEYKDIWTEMRSDCLGIEVQRRIVLGNYVSYSGYIDGYYNKARKLLQIMWNKLEHAFQEVDFIILPTYPGAGMTVKESLDPDPIKAYLCDTYTCLANLLGLPAINVPTRLSNTTTPLGIQIMAAPLNDISMLQHANMLDKHFDFYNKHALSKKLLSF